MKNVKKNAVFFKLYRYKVFVHWKLKLLNFLVDSVLILVFVNENCCLCKCFTELYFFYWLLVVSCNFSRSTVCFYELFMNITCRSIQNAARIKRLLRLHIVLKRNSINFHSNTRPQLALLAPVKRENRLAGRIGDFGNFLNGFAKSPRLIVLNIDWVN